MSRDVSIHKNCRSLLKSRMSDLSHKHSVLSMKRPATAAPAAASSSKSKKAKVSRKQSHQLQHMADIIDSVGSQSLSRTVSVDEASVEADAGEALSQEAITACNNLHAEIAKLTNIVQQQQEKICNMAVQMMSVLTLLQTITQTQQTQQNLSSTGLVTAPQTTTHAKEPHHSTTGEAGGRSAKERSEHVERTGGAAQFERSVNSSQRKNNQRCAVSEESDESDDSRFTMIVHRTINDMSKRRRNVIVTGLAEEEDSGKSDQDTFEDFCECFLPFKPCLAAGGNSCRRIGKSINGKPRRLLIKLNSEEAATAMLQFAPSLRQSTCQEVAAGVFINADLSTAAAKLAYEARQKRREVQKRRSGSVAAAVSTNTSSPMVQASGIVDAVSTASTSDLQSGSTSAAVDMHRPSNSATVSAAANISSPRCSSLDANAVPFVTGSAGNSVASATIAPSGVSIQAPAADGVNSDRSSDVITGTERGTTGCLNHTATTDSSAADHPSTSGNPSSFRP